MHICGDIDNKIGKGEEMRLRKRVHSAVIATVLTCSMAVTPVFAEPDTLESLQEEQENLQNQKEAAQNELNSLQSDLDTIVTKLADLEDQLIAKGEEIIQIKADLEAAEEKRHPRPRRNWTRRPPGRRDRRDPAEAPGRGRWPRGRRRS